MWVFECTNKNVDVDADSLSEMLEILRLHRGEINKSLAKLGAEVIDPCLITHKLIFDGSGTLDVDTITQIGMLNCELAIPAKGNA